MSGWSSLTTLKKPQHTTVNQHAWLLQGMGSSTFGVGRYTTPRRGALLLLASQIAKLPNGHVIITLETVKTVSLSDTRGLCLISLLVMSKDVFSGYGRLLQGVFPLVHICTLLCLIVGGGSLFIVNKALIFQHESNFLNF